MNLRQSNPVADFAGGYGFVDNIITKREDRAVAAEERQRKRTFEDEDRARRATEWGQQQDDRNSVLDQQVLNAAMMDVDRISKLGLPRPQQIAELKKSTERLSAKQRPAFMQWLAEHEGNEDIRTATQEFHQGMATMQQGDYEGGLGRVLPALNRIYKDEIMKGGGRPGMKVNNKEIVGVLPYEDKGVVFQVKVTGVDEATGEAVEYMAPITEGRDGSPDARVRIFSVDEVAGNIDKRDMLAEFSDYAKQQLVGLGDSGPLKEQQARAQGMAIAKNLPPAQQKIMDEYLAAGIPRAEALQLAQGSPRKAWKTQEVAGPNGMPYVAVLDEQGREMARYAAVGDGSGGAGGTGGSGLPAEARLIEYYISKGMDFDAARKETKRAKDNPRKWAADHYQNLVKAENEMAAMTGAAPRSAEELRKQADADARYFFGAEEKTPVATKGPGAGMRYLTPNTPAPPYAGPLRQSPAVAAAKPAVPTAKPAAQGGGRPDLRAFMGRREEL